eukprot:SM000234S07882  [mRNA]  locus=s234:49571:51979:+ [translate_table: standard]
MVGPHHCAEQQPAPVAEQQNDATSESATNRTDSPGLPLCLGAAGRSFHRTSTVEIPGALDEGEECDNEDNGKGSAKWKGFLRGGLAAMAGGAVAHPLDLIKVQMQIQGERLKARRSVARGSELAGGRSSKASGRKTQDEVWPRPESTSSTNSTARRQQPSALALLSDLEPAESLSSRSLGVLDRSLGQQEHLATSSDNVGKEEQPLDSLAMTLRTVRLSGPLALFKGISGTLLRQFMYSGARFGIYDVLKDLLASIYPSQPLPLAFKAGAGMIGGSIGALVSTPAELATVRMQAGKNNGSTSVTDSEVDDSSPQLHKPTALIKNTTSWAASINGNEEHQHSAATTPPSALRVVRREKAGEGHGDTQQVFGEPARFGVIGVLAQVVREEGGILGLWQGCWPSVVRSMIATATQVCTYETIKEQLLQHALRGFPVFLISGVCAGLMSSLLSNPVDVIKTRVMNSGRDSQGRSKYKGLADCGVQTIATEGVGALYAGFLPATVIVVTYVMTLFITMEQVRKIL